jgi:hypothetical protein
MESANRVLTRRALDVLKSIATGEYVPPEERHETDEPSSDIDAEINSEEMGAETDAAASPREKQDDTPPETQVLIEPTNAEESEPVIGDTSVDPEVKSE